MDFQRLQAFFERDQFARQNGIRLVEARTGFARAELTVEPRHLNAVGILQGGAVFTLADFAFAVACQTDLTFFKPVCSGTLTATAEEIARTRRLSTCLIRVTDEQHDLVALFKGVAFIKDTPLDII